MARVLVQKIWEEIKRHLLRAEHCKAREDLTQMRVEAEAAVTLFGPLLTEASDPLAMFEHVRATLLSFGYSGEEFDSLLAAKKSKKTKKKIDIEGRTSGGAEHKHKKRPSTKGKHQKGRKRRRQSYGGEKGDDGRRRPRKKPCGWAGPWPPQETEKQSNEGSETQRPEHKGPQQQLRGIANPLHSGLSEFLFIRGDEEQIAKVESQMVAGQQQYEEALRLSRAADKNGGLLPVELLREAADTGYPPAVYALANWHLHGKGVKKDYKKAFSLLTKAANKRFVPAEYDLAVSYERGKGVDKSNKKAWYYYLQAAKDGNLQAQTEVARCFYHGIGTTKDFAKAVEWYRKAATRGDSDAQYALGVAYEHGEGVEKNIHKAVHWYKKAAEQGDEEAAKALAELDGKGE